MMVTRHRRRSILQRLWLPVVALGVLGYFGYHAFNGDFGLWARERLVSDVARLTADRDRLIAEREALERRVASVKPDSLDADVVDMHARQSLGYLREDEVVLRLGAVQQ